MLAVVIIEILLFISQIAQSLWLASMTRPAAIRKYPVVDNIQTQSKESIREHLRGSITVQLTCCLAGLEMSLNVWCTELRSAQTHISKLVKQEVNRTVILPL